MKDTDEIDEELADWALDALELKTKIDQRLLEQQRARDKRFDEAREVCRRRSWVVVPWWLWYPVLAVAVASSLVLLLELVKSLAR